MRPLLLLSAGALVCSTAVFIHTGIPAASQNGRARAQLERRVAELETAAGEPQRWTSKHQVTELSARLLRTETHAAQLIQGLLTPKQSFAAFLVSHEGPLPGFAGSREDTYLELANQTLAVAARSGIPREQPFLGVRSSDEFRAMSDPQQDLLLQRTFLTYRLIDQLSRAHIKDIRLLDIARVSESPYVSDTAPHRITITFAAPLEDGFAAIAGFLSLSPPPVCDLTAVELERLEPSELGLAAIDFRAPPLLFRWEMNWLSGSAP